MRSTWLSSLDLPGDLKRMSIGDLTRVAHEVRDLIIDVVSSNGGHLAPSLGVVDLTIALLAVMDLPTDKIIWDVGHQCYAYKILTQRLHRFHTLRQQGGISGFPKPQESPYDAFATGHASTAISAALGIALGRNLSGETYRVAAVVGDGALGGGMAWEAINNAGASKANLLVVLNDNKMSISPSIGALAAHITRLRTMPFYRTVEDNAERLFGLLPMGGGLLKKAAQTLKRGLTNWISPTSGCIFEALGFHYLGPIDGHDLGQLRKVIAQALELSGPVLLHVVTTKGKGYFPAEHNARHYHGIGPFNSSNGKVSEKGRITYTDVFGGTLMRLARRDPRIVVVTAAMPDGTGLTRFAKKYPTRFFNVGIAEQHAVTFAAGLATAGQKPVVAIYSTFMQRAYDQIVHDVCLQNLPVVLALDRGGIVGEDGPTHHGAFDLSYLRHIPNLTIMAPRDAAEMGDMLFTAVTMNCPTAIRYPRGTAVGNRRLPLRSIPIGRAEALREGRHVALVAIGTSVNPALEAARELELMGIEATVINARFAKPLDDNTICKAIADCRAAVLIEENTCVGGFAGAVLESMASQGVREARIEIVALPDSFIEHGKASDLRMRYGLSAAGIVDAAIRALGESEIRAKSKGECFVIRQSI
jgi:1-deoxy-D-xylulose-5-phosphate synthase